MTDKIEVRAYRFAHPEATLQEIGNIFDLTGERIRQILNESGDNTCHDDLFNAKCAYCGNPLNQKGRIYCGPYCSDAGQSGGPEHGAHKRRHKRKYEKRTFGRNKTP
jgi:hypothetical protein